MLLVPLSITCTNNSATWILLVGDVEILFLLLRIVDLFPNRAKKSLTDAYSCLSGLRKVQPETRYDK